MDWSISIHSIADKNSRCESRRHNVQQTSADKDTESPDSSVSSLSGRTEYGQNVENIFSSQLIG